MKFTQDWLKDYIAVTDIKQVADQLSLAGLEVDHCGPSERDANVTLVDIDLTPNRGDCLSLLGIARELHALTTEPYQAFTVKPVLVTGSEKPQVELAAKQACARCCARMVEQFDQAATTPEWMIHRLSDCGIASHSLAVDITNYVMLSVGQPMHAFDADKVNGAITVRFAKKDENITLLDGKSITLTDKDLVIADDQQVLALAGIMGGQSSMVTDNTKKVLLESAFFDPITISHSLRRHQLHSDSAYRFERGVDFEIAKTAMEYASQLWVELASAKLGPMVHAQLQQHLPKREPITLRAERIKRILGCEFESQQVADILQRLGANVSGAAPSWQVIPPSHRFDLSIEVDLIEELARVQGYQNITPKLPTLTMKATAKAAVDPSESFKQQLVARGFQEVISYSFIDEATEKLFNPDCSPLKLLNPISQELSVMRSSLWPSLLKTVYYNQQRQVARCALFEAGLRFSADNPLQAQTTFAGVMAGTRVPLSWHQKPQDIDFYDIKLHVEALLAFDPAVEYIAASHPALAKGACAKILQGKTLIGWMGKLAPSIQKTLDIQLPIVLFEIYTDHLAIPHQRTFAGISKYPSVRRDIALLVKQEVTVAKLQACIRQSMGSLLEELFVFDVYQGKGIEPGYKSIAMGVVIRDRTATLTEVQVEAMMKQVYQALSKSYQATLREA